jgi:hypothetical protein
MLVLAVPSLAEAQPAPCTVQNDIHFHLGSMVWKAPRSHHLIAPQDIRRQPSEGGVICDHPIHAPAAARQIVVVTPILEWPEQDRSPLPVVAVSAIIKQKPGTACDRPLSAPRTVKSAEDPELDEDDAFKGNVAKRRIFYTKVNNTALFAGSFHKIECGGRVVTPGGGSPLPLLCSLRMDLKSACADLRTSRLPVSLLRAFSARAEMQIQKMIVDSR